MTRPVTRAALSIAVLVALCAAGALAQRALDANTNVLSGRRNPTTQGVTMGKPIYKVNERTGEMVYNRSVAFNDPTYNIYQRHTISRWDYNSTTVPQRAIPGVNDTVYANTLALQGGAAQLKRSKMGGGFKAPTYSTVGRAHAGKQYTAGAGRAGGLKQPTYRVSGARRYH